MAAVTQIYEKTYVRVCFVFVLCFVFNSCITSTLSTATLDLSDRQSVKGDSINRVTLEKQSVYYFGTLTFNRYDRFESNIFDQLRISLYSEARYIYPDFDLVEISQNQKYRFFKTTYSVTGVLVRKTVIKNRLKLLTHSQENNTIEPEEREKKTSANDQIVLKSQKESRFLETDYVNVEIENDRLSSASVRPENDLSERIRIVTEDSSKAITVENITNVWSDENIAVQTDLTGKVVYVVACFKPKRFDEEKFLITQKEVGFPLSYYTTGKWVRIYLKGEFENWKEAKSIAQEAWPITYGN